jgi:hypothetical protein
MLPKLWLDSFDNVKKIIGKWIKSTTARSSNLACGGVCLKDELAATQDRCACLRACCHVKKIWIPERHYSETYLAIGLSIFRSSAWTNSLPQITLPVLSASSFPVMPLKMPPASRTMIWPAAMSQGCRLRSQ